MLAGRCTLFAARGLALAGLAAASLGAFFSPPTAPLELTPICAIQSRAFDSPYAGKTVRTQGVVYADLDMTSRKGFFLQAEYCDADPLTSDGIFVYLGAKADAANPGDRVEVLGEAQEYYGMTRINAAPGDIRRLSSGNPLPAAHDLNPPFDNALSRRYFETLEGMYVKLDEALAVGPTGDSGQTWLVGADLGVRRVFPDDPAGSGEIVCADDGGLFEIDPQARVGDGVRGLSGALEYAMGVYCLELVTPPVLVPQLAAPAAGPADASPAIQGTEAFSFTAATFNLGGLFDTLDDPATQDTVLSSGEYQRRLQKRALAIHKVLGEPALLAVQEAENRTVLQHLAARSEIQAEYGIVWIDGPDEQGMEVALLYRTGQVRVLDFQSRQGCTALVDGLGPDGNHDVSNPANGRTCDSDGNGSLDGNRLFSRPPLLVHVQVCAAGCEGGGGGGEQAAPREQAVEAWLVINHWKSKVEDSATVQYTLPRREEEARFVAALSREVLAGGPGRSLVVLGDLNDHPGSPPLLALSPAALANPWAQVDRPERYTFNYRGVSQVLDHVLVNLAPPLALLSITPLHINADYPVVFAEAAGAVYRSSDHDPLLVELKMLANLAYLPLIRNQR